VRNDPAIAAVTEIPPGRYPDFDELGLHLRVLDEFLDQWQVKPGEIDGVLAAPTGVLAEGGADISVHEKVADELGINPRYAQSMYAGGATYALMVARASAAIAAGEADAVLCISAGKFPKVGAAGGEKIARFASHPEFEFPYGVYIPVLYAMAATRYLAETGCTHDDLAAVSVSQREWSLRHPDAFMRSKGAITIADVAASRMVASPFHLLDCSVPLEGGAAVLVTGGEMARRIAGRPAYYLGHGEAHFEAAVSQRARFDTGGAEVSSARAYRAAGITPSEIDIAQLYDSFSSNPLMYAEECGLLGRGKAGEHYRSGAASPGGSLPINTYGGLMSFGHTGDASGMSMIVEAALQVMGRADERQVPRSSTALVHTHGGMLSEHATLLLGDRAEG
jgi:acetyl-CoA acetyltransferase